MTAYTLRSGITIPGLSSLGSVNNYVTIPDAAAYNLGANWSIGFWIQLHRGIIGGYNVMSQWTTGNTDNCIAIQINNTGRIYVYVAASAGDAANNLAYSDAASIATTSTAKHHVVVTGSGSTVTIYVDGAAKTTTVVGSIASSLRNSAAPWIIGSLAGTSAAGEGYAPHPMDVTHLGLWNVALSPSQVTSDYGLDRPTTGLVAWFGQTAVSGTTWTDSVSANNGTLVDDASPCWFATQGATAEPICCIGDSTALGAANPSAYTRWSQLIGWRKTLADALGGDPATTLKYPFVGPYATGVMAQNRHAGISGNTTAQVAARIPALLTDYPFSHAVFCFGINDIRVGMSVNTFITGYQAACALVLDAGKTLRYMTIPPSSDGSFGPNIPTFNAALVALEATLRAIYGDGKVYCVRVDIDFPAAGKADTLHPNQAGHEHMGGCAWKWFDVARTVPSNLNGALGTVTGGIGVAA